MDYGAKEDLAMILPIPVVHGSNETAVRFYNLSQYPTLFDDLNAGFPDLVYDDSKASFSAAPQSRSKPKLNVVTVGSYDASFIPTIDDFSRLDERFRLPQHTWQNLPGYAKYGFAVFKLKAAKARAHPMAFSFPSAVPQQLFFPTVHIHDGKIHSKAKFDHALYCQGSNIRAEHWRESPQTAIQFAKCGLTHGIISPGHHIYRRTVIGTYANGDFLLQANKLPT